MPKDGNWKPYNVDYLERNVREVFKSGDIGKLTKGTYDFIIQHMGFIAHYDLLGFQCEYADLELFREKLQTSEYSQDPEYNLRWADSCEFDGDFVKWYGEAYCRSKAEGIRRIVAVARSQFAQPMPPIPAWELKLTERRGGMKERIIRMGLTDLEKILKEQGSIKKDEFLNDAHIEPNELVMRVLYEDKKSS